MKKNKENIKVYNKNDVLKENGDTNEINEIKSEKEDINKEPTEEEKKPIEEEITQKIGVISTDNKKPEEPKEKYEVKLPKNEESKEKPETKNLEQSPIPIQEKLEIPEKTENKKVSFSLEQSLIPIFKTKEKERKKDVTKKLRFSEDDDIKKMRMKIKKNISKFLDDFIEENKIKRANSMMSLRSSKTISSVTTCDDSICLDDTNVGKYKINLNNLMLGNEEKNNKTKEMVQRSKNLYQVYLDQQQDSKDKKNKCGKNSCY